MLTTDDLRDDHYRYDAGIPQGWDAVRDVCMVFNGEHLLVQYGGQPGHAVALVHAYLQSEYELTRRRH